MGMKKKQGFRDVFFPSMLILGNLGVPSKKEQPFPLNFNTSGTPNNQKQTVVS
jgi:hypothetical protein